MSTDPVSYLPIIIVIFWLAVIITVVSFIIKCYKLAKERNEILKEIAMHRKDDLDK